MRKAADLLTHARRASTKESYGTKWTRFHDFCTRTLPREYNRKPACPLPAKRRTVIKYLAHLQLEGRVHVASLQPYISAINQAHEDLGYARPGLDLEKVRRAFGALEAREQRDEDRDVRVPVPADVIYDIAVMAVNTPDRAMLRACAAVVLGFCWFARPDSGVKLQRKHVTFGLRGVTLNFYGKTVPVHTSCPIHRDSTQRFDPEGLVLSVLRRWHKTSAQWQTRDSPYWCLPSDMDAQRSAAVTSWLRIACDAVHAAPPAGEKWTGQSLRSGGASASLSIGVDMFFIMKHGHWKTHAAVQRYLKFLVQPTDAAYLFFGWMLPPLRPDAQGDLPSSYLRREVPVRAGIL